MKAKIAVFALLLASVSALAQSDGMVHVKSFPGSTVGQMMTNAMLSCPSAPVPCIVVLDASLAAYPSGSLPSACPNCSVVDFRTGWPTTGGATLPVILASKYMHCDGSTADSANFTTAMAAAVGQILAMPPGATCILDSAVTINPGVVAIEGNGATLQAKSGFSGGGVGQMITVQKPTTYFRMQDLIFNCGGNATTALWVNGLQHGVIAHNVMQNCNGDGVVLKGILNYGIYYNDFADNYSTSNAGRGWDVNSTGTAAYVNNNTFLQDHATRNGGDGWYVVGSSFEGTNLESECNAGYGIHFSNISTQATLTGGYFENDDNGQGVSSCANTSTGPDIGVYVESNVYGLHIFGGHHQGITGPGVGINGNLLEPGGGFNSNAFYLADLSPLELTTASSEPGSLDIVGALSGAGLLQNLLTYSNTFTNAAWTTSTLTVTASAGNGPDGSTNTAAQLNLSTSANNYLRQNYSYGASIQNQCFVGSVWMRASSGTVVTNIRLADGADSNGVSAQYFLDTNWRRLWVANCFSGSTSTSVGFSAYYFQPKWTGNVLVWGAQLVHNPAGTPNAPAPYIATTSAAFGSATSPVWGIVVNGIPLTSNGGRPAQATGSGAASNQLAYLSDTSGGGSTGGTVTYTASQAASTSDNGKLVVMNCSSACAYTLPATQPSSTWYAWIISTGSSVATIALGGGDTFNESTSVPALNSFRPLHVRANSSVTSDYVGEAPLVVGAGLSATAASNGLTLSGLITPLEFGGGGAGTLAGGTTEYLVWGAKNTAATNVGYNEIMPAAGTFTAMYAAVQAAPGSGNSNVLTAYLCHPAGTNCTAQAITCPINNTATSCSDTAHSFSYAAGDGIVIQSVPSASATSSFVTISLR